MVLVRNSDLASIFSILLCVPERLVYSHLYLAAIVRANSVLLKLEPFLSYLCICVFFHVPLNLRYRG